MHNKGAILLQALFVLLIQTERSQTDSSWGYNGKTGPDHWPQIFKRFCSGRRQSPIDLSFKDSKYDPSLSHYTFPVPELKTTANFTVVNDGHKIEVNVDKANFKVGVSNQRNFCFRPHGLHFHWGSSNKVGSEHWLNGRQYAMEGHLLTWDCQFYPNVSAALNGIDGLAVFGFFYEVVKDAPNDPILQSIIDTFSKLHVKQCGTCSNGGNANLTESIKPFDLGQLIPKNRLDFWQYSGSLTTPDCRENVRWTVYNTPKPIPQKQMDAFRKLKYPPVNGKSLSMVNNFRNLMKLNPSHPPGPQRLLSRSFKNSASKAFISTAIVIKGALLFALMAQS